jgi:hypothetical protein
MGMTNTVRELKKDMDEMMDEFKAKLGAEVFDNEFIDPELIKMMQKMFHMYDLSMKLMEQQADTIERMDEKLDKLLEKIS